LVSSTLPQLLLPSRITSLKIQRVCFKFKKAKPRPVSSFSLTLLPDASLYATTPQMDWME
jgi:hypothetical protein